MEEERPVQVAEYRSRCVACDGGGDHIVDKLKITIEVVE